MKFTVEVEIDWVDDDGGLDEAVKKEIIRGVEAKICKRADSEITEAIDKKLATVIDDRLNEMITGWLAREVSVTNTYGDVVENGTIESLLQERFDKFWAQKVDNKGRSGREGYGNQQSRMAWLQNQKIKDKCTKFAQELAKTMDAQIADGVSDALRTALGDRLVKTLGVEKIIADVKQLAG